MKLRDLIPRLKKPLVTGSTDVEIESVTADSRQVGSGCLFVAIRGARADGRRFIGQAVEAGAVAVLSETPPETDDPGDIPWIQVADARLALSALAAALAGDPSRALKLVGVTGTNGKTTVGFLCHHLMKSQWHRVGLLGTVVTDDGLESHAAGHTTPDAVMLQGLLARMNDHGCRGAVLEVSSHGIEQRRVADVAFDALVFTNLSQDHLDYHGTMANYFASKASWFERAAADGRGKKPQAIINMDDPYGVELAGKLVDRLPVIRYGFGVHADFRALEFRQNARGLELKLAHHGRQYLVRAPLIGRFNVHNILAALAAAKTVGIPLRGAVAALAETPQVPGRMEHCGGRDGVSVFVDYAHSPDALDHACRTLRELQPKRLITVFGCGGDRDRSKRPKMGAAAARHSDACILTSDNPRSEDPERIIDAIKPGMGGAKYRRVADRAEAIRIAIHAAGRGDIVLIAGKGHEPNQQIGHETFEFDDRKEAKRALRERPLEESPEDRP